MVEQAVRNVIFINGRSVKRPLIVEDGRRFTSYLLQPPRSLTQAEYERSDLRFYKSRSEEINMPAPIWGARYPGWLPIRENYNHQETRFLYWMAYGIDVHYPTVGVVRKNKCCWKAYDEPPGQSEAAKKSKVNEWLDSSYDAEYAAKDDLENRRDYPDSEEIKQQDKEYEEEEERKEREANERRRRSQEEEKNISWDSPESPPIHEQGDFSANSASPQSEEMPDLVDC